MPGTSKYSMGKRSSAKPVEVTLPSFATDDNGHPTTEHNKCLVRVPDPSALIGMGILDSVDSLTRLAGMKIDEIEASGRPSKSQAQQIKDLSESKDALMEGLQLIDKIVEWMVVEPSCVRPVRRDKDGKPVKGEDGKEIPLLSSERADDVLYTDDVDLEDRMFILNYAVGGTSDLEAFREGTAAIMDVVAPGENVQVPTV